MAYNVIPLTLNLMRDNLSAILKMDSYIIAAESWDERHFLDDVPGKWECSRIAFDEGKLISFMIATFKTESVHINRIVTDPQYQGVGIATRLLELAALIAQENQKKFVTLKVSQQNQKAITFYKHRGFQIIESSDNNLMLSIKTEALLSESKMDL